MSKLRQSRGGTAKAAEPTRRHQLNLRRRLTNQLGSRARAEPTDEAGQSEPEEPTDNHPGRMKWIEDIAKMQIKEPADPAAVDKSTVVNYLDTKGIERFADVLVAYRQEQSAAAVRSLDGQAWDNGVQMAVTGVLTNYSQPQLLRQSSAFKAGGPIWNLVDKTGGRIQHRLGH